MSDRTPPERISIKPCRGLRVRKPNGQLLDPAGEAVTWSGYWRRRELDGDIERVISQNKPARRATRPAPSATAPTE
ncbi:DUF2635 domain-containing protein [Pseudomonas resinovorans]|uniref:DUF2635 domain-containing protein n=1 Tax=Metapseudomonas resinovorans TaxID=53412 RepID=A0ABT4Y412_METRE|nr:DUF2635 domain-containing protein [Pseudomonas resinovorans]MDA8483593.1 DUF2635 domain-containing protein [Pseudomonas resinovorans]